jgi:hypothetical protein
MEGIFINSITMPVRIVSVDSVKKSIGEPHSAFAGASLSVESIVVDHKELRQ